MTIEEMEAIFSGERADKHIISPARRLHPRDDINAFLLLDKLVPPQKGDNMISAAEHDQIWLTTDLEYLAKAATDEDILDLSACGVWLYEEGEALSMFC